MDVNAFEILLIKLNVFIELNEMSLFCLIFNKIHV